MTGTPGRYGYLRLLNLHITMSTTHDVAIVGAGITGSSLAAQLSATSLRVALIDRDVRGLPGSTGHAPGFVGIYNQLPVLTELAKRSVAHYSTIPGGFANVGGLEIDGDVGRAAAAMGVGLDAAVLNGADAVAKAPELVKSASAGVWFPGDGVADARVITHSFQNQAEGRGAILIDGDVRDITSTDDGYVLTFGDKTLTLTARHVVICTNIWADELAKGIPAIPVAHPYAYSREHGGSIGPFVRWPSVHVYARDHGGRYGFGSYDHDPVAVAAGASAYGPWLGEFDEPMDKGRRLMPDRTAALFDGWAARGEELHDEREPPAQIKRDTAYAFNGVFCVTPDGLPLAGRIKGEGKRGVWCILGSWVTHAAGNAEVVAGMIKEAEGLEGQDKWGTELCDALNPLRFAGDDTAAAAALRTYNDIYNSDQ